MISLGSIKSQEVGALRAPLQVENRVLFPTFYFNYQAKIETTMDVQAVLADLGREQILSLGIKFAAVYKTVRAIPIDAEDPAADIVRDFVVGFKAAGASERATIARCVGTPGGEELVGAAIKDAGWTALRTERAFYKALATSLGRDCRGPDECNGTATTGVDPSAEACLGARVGRPKDQIMFEAKLNPLEYKARVEALAGHVAGILEKGGARAARAIRDRRAPEFQAPTKPGECAGIRATITYEYELERLASREKEWEDTKSTIFDVFVSRCAPSMMSKLRGMAGWEEIEATQDGIEVLKMLDQALAGSQAQGENESETNCAEVKMAKASCAEVKMAEANCAEVEMTEAKCAEARMAEAKCAKAKMAEAMNAKVKMAEVMNAQVKMAEAKNA